MITRGESGTNTAAYCGRSTHIRLTIDELRPQLNTDLAVLYSTFFVIVVIER